MRAKAKTREVPVRPKASQRKGRTAVVVHTARAPTQERSQRRFSAILDATEALLEKARIEDISFYDIARKAGISPASVHYLFPSMAAVRLELTRRSNSDLLAVLAQVTAEVEAAGEQSWQHWVRALAERVRRLFNESRPLAEITLGPTLNRETRVSNVETNDLVAKSLLEAMRSVFLVPEIPRLELMFSLAGDVFDALWSRSYTLHGQIDDETFEESMRMVLAYLRAVLPETLTLRASIQREQSKDVSRTPVRGNSK